MRRSLRATLAGSLLSAASYAMLIALLLADRLSDASAVPAAVGVQQLATRLSGIGFSIEMIYENSLFLDDLDSFLDLARA